MILFNQSGESLMAKRGKGYSREFKIEAVKLSYNSDKGIEDIAALNCLVPPITDLPSTRSGGCMQNLVIPTMALSSPRSKNSSVCESTREEMMRCGRRGTLTVRPIGIKLSNLLL
jgi:hypothetical protein